MSPDRKLHHFENASLFNNSALFNPFIINLRLHGASTTPCKLIVVSKEMIIYWNEHININLSFESYQERQSKSAVIEN